MAQKIFPNHGSVIITGASEGIGRALALEFARLGFSLGLIARRAELLEAVCKECVSLGAPRAQYQTGDVSDLAVMRAAYQNLEKSLGAAAIFVANAGINIDITCEKNGDEVAQKIFAVNVSGAVAGLEYFKAKWVLESQARENLPRVLVGVSSVAGSRGLPGGGIYCASKAALSAYLEALELDLLVGQLRSISVVDLAPGFIDTAMTRRNKFPMPFLGDAQKECRAFVAAVLSSRSGRIVRPLPFALVYPVLKHTPWFLLRLLLRVAGNWKASRRNGV